MQDSRHVAAVLAAVAGAGLLVSAQPAAPALDQLKNATVSGIYDRPVVLKDGVYEGEPYVKGGAARPRLVLISELVATGDLDGSPGNEAAVLLSETSGGSGEFIHLAAFASREGKVVQLGVAKVGDRVKIRDLRVAARAILLDVVEAGPNDAMCCPTQLAQRTYAVQSGALKPESSTVTGTLSVGILSGSAWTLVSMDRRPLPSGAAPPTITFDGNGVSGFGGCNRYRGNLKEAAPGRIDIGPLLNTRMACQQPRMEVEDRFLASLGEATSYTFLMGRLVIGGSDGTSAHELVFETRPGS